jgi:hypothetical protein
VQGLDSLLTEGVDLPPLLANAYDRRRKLVGLLRGRAQTLRERRRVNVRVARAAAGLSSDSDARSDDGDSGGERSDDEARPMMNNLALATRRSAAAQRAKQRAGPASALGGVTPTWLTSARAAQPAKMPDAEVFSASGATAQARARALVARVQSRSQAQGGAAASAHAPRIGVLPLCDDSVLWAVREKNPRRGPRTCLSLWLTRSLPRFAVPQPFADDLPLPLLLGDSRLNAAAAARDGMPRACLVIDSEPLPVQFSKDVPERHLTLAPAVRCMSLLALCTRLHLR